MEGEDEHVGVEDLPQLLHLDGDPSAGVDDCGVAAQAAEVLAIAVL